MIASPSHTLPVILSTHSLCLLSSQSGQWAPIWMNVFVLKSKKTYGMLIFEACQKLSGNSFWMCSVFLGFFKCWISWWFYLFSLPLISLPSVGSSQCFSELFCQWPDRQWHGQLEEHGEKGRGGSSWWQGHAPASYHCKSPEGLCCQPIRCGENSAFV